MRLPFLFLAAALMGGCSYTIDKTAKAGPVASGGLAPGFSEVRAKIFSPACAECHLQYEEYEYVRDDAAKIQSAVNENRMPKRFPLTADLKDLLNRWIEGGAPRDPETVTAEPEKPLTADWESLRRRIFVPKCLVCHNPQGQAPWINLSDRASAVKTLLPFINLAKPEDSYLMERLSSTEEPMPPFEYSLEQLNAEEIALVLQWLALGLP
jgi:mono/diheme cytochrome c family protein